MLNISKIQKRKSIKNRIKENNKLSHQFELENLVENPKKLNGRFRESVKSKAASEFSFYDNYGRPSVEFTYLRNVSFFMFKFK